MGGGVSGDSGAGRGPWPGDWSALLFTCAGLQDHSVSGVEMV